MGDHDVEVAFDSADGQWHVRGPGGEALASHHDKSDAVDAGRAAAERRGLELVIRNQDGRT